MKKIETIKKLKILFFIKLFFGTITIVFFDMILGIIILIAGVITMFWIIMVKNKIEHEKEKLLAYLHIIIGILMFLGVIVIMLTSNTNEFFKIITKILIGSILIFKGIYEAYIAKKTL